MKKILLLLVLVFLGFIAFSWMASHHSVEIARAQGVIEAARAAQIASQGLSDVSRGHTFILVVLTLVLVVLVGSVVYIAIRRQIWKHAQILLKNSSRWDSDQNIHWKRVENPADPYQQLLLQQQMLLTQLLQQNQMEAVTDDQPQLLDSWWE